MCKTQSSEKVVGDDKDQQSDRSIIAIISNVGCPRGLNVTLQRLAPLDFQIVSCMSGLVSAVIQYNFLAVFYG
jgi:hypothetical protein